MNAIFYNLKGFVNIQKFVFIKNIVNIFVNIVKFLYAQWI